MTPAKFNFELLTKNKESFIKAISQYYPLTEQLLENYSQLWDWELVSKNREINWGMPLLEKFKNKLVWSHGRTLSSNPALPWSVELIKKFLGKQWQWDDLMWQEKVFQDPEMLALCLPQWYKNARQYLKNSNRPDSDLSMYKYFQFTPWGENAKDWAPALVENTEKLHWDLFSGVEGFPWTAEFIEKHQKKLCWRRLSWNSGLPWGLEFIKQFEDQWDWTWMSYKIPWTMEMIDEFKDRINWRMISSEEKISFLEELVKKYPNRVEWVIPDHDHGCWEGTFDGIINSDQLTWTPELYESVNADVESFFQKMANNDDEIELLTDENETAHWTYFCDTDNWTLEFLKYMLEIEKIEGISAVSWSDVCGGAKEIWSPSFIETHKEKLIEHIDDLCVNKFFPWDEFWGTFKGHISEYGLKNLVTNNSFNLTEAFIEEHKEKNIWQSISYRNDLSQKLLEKYKDELNWVWISKNESYPLELLQQFPDHAKWKSVSRREDLKIADIDFSLPWNWQSIFNNQPDLVMTDYMDEEILLDFLDQIK